MCFLFKKVIKITETFIKFQFKYLIKYKQNVFKEVGGPKKDNIDF